MKRHRYRFGEQVRDHLGILAGSILFGIAYSWFLFPFRVSPGGVGGISQVLFNFTSIPESIWMLAFNIPLFGVGCLVVGSQFGIRSFIGMLLSNAMCWVFDPNHLELCPRLCDQVHNVAASGDAPRLAVFFTGQNETDILLASLAGSTLLGIGLGLIFKFRGSTGGTDIPVAILKKYTAMSISTGYWFVESAIILLVCVTLGDPKLAIWAYVNLFVSSKMTDFAAEGMPYVKAAVIITRFPDKVRDAVSTNLNRGVTFLKAEGGHSRNKKDMIYVCVHRRQVQQLRRLVMKVDPKAFMVLHDAYDVMGYGFRQRTLTY